MPARWFKQDKGRVLSPGDGLKAALVVMIGLCAILWGFVYPDAHRCRWLLQRLGYPGMFLTFAWWICALARVGRPLIKRISWFAGLKREGGVALIWWFGLMAVACLSVSYAYRVLFDELVLQSTALNLHFFRELGTLMRGHEIEGVFQSLGIYLDKRPFFFPFLVSLVHDFAGFRDSNAFVLNTVLMGISLALVYGLGRAVGGVRGGLVALACFGASPLLAQNGAGTGMEMLNVTMILLGAAVGMRYLRSPDGAGQDALLLTVVLLAQTRYESAIYVGSAGLVILEGWRRSGRIIFSAALFAAPVLLIPYAWHHVYLSATPQLWELREDVTTRFSAAFAPDNLYHAFRYFFVIAPDILNVWWLSVLGWPAALGCAVIVWRRRRSFHAVRPEAWVCVAFSLGVAGNLALLMVYYWGHLDDPMVWRLALPVYAVLALALAYMIGRFADAFGALAARWVLAGSVVCYLGIGMRSTAYCSELSLLAREIAWETDWVKQRPVVPRLIISGKTTLNWMMERTSALPISLAIERADRVRFHMEAGTFREVLVLQHLKPIGRDGGFVIAPGHVLPARFVVEPLVERQIGGKLLRISRVVKILPNESNEGALVTGS